MENCASSHASKDCSESASTVLFVGPKLLCVRKRALSSREFVDGKGAMTGGAGSGGSGVGGVGVVGSGIGAGVGVVGVGRTGATLALPPLSEPPPPHADKDQTDTVMIKHAPMRTKKIFTRCCPWAM